MPELKGHTHDQEGKSIEDLVMPKNYKGKSKDKALFPKITESPSTHGMVLPDTGGGIEVHKEIDPVIA